MECSHFVEKGGFVMPICTNCNNKWSWKQTFKKIMTMSSEMLCPYCGEKQYQSKKSRIIAPFLNLIILLPLLIQTLFDVSKVLTLSLIPFLAGSIFLLYPFLVRLSSKYEFPFSG